MRIFCCSLPTASHPDSIEDCSLWLFTFVDDDNNNDEITNDRIRREEDMIDEGVLTVQSSCIVLSSWLLLSFYEIVSKEAFLVVV